MKGQTLLSVVAAAGLVSSSPAKPANGAPQKRATLTAVTAKGNAFWVGNERFYLRGIDYQPGGSSADKDPLGDPDVCERDIKQFKDLGVNTIRVYSVDNSKNHDKCMQALSDAGIYLVLDVNTPKYSINRADPKPSYNTKYLQNVFATVEMFAKYPNTLAFFSGNEVINEQKGTEKSAPYVKAVTRDIKNYLNSRGLRKVPVGYSAADVMSNRMETAMYMNCGTDDMRSDFFAFNDYSWCNSDFTTSGWDQKVKNFTDYGLPIFLSEWGCTKSRPRKFEEMGALMSSQMSSVYSGGLMYEYSVEENKFGIVTLDGDKVTTSDEFDLYRDALKANPMPTGSGGAASTTHAVACPTSDASWSVDPTRVPSMPSEAEKYMKSGAGDGAGFSGDGSQNAEDSGTSTADVTGGKPSPSSSSQENAGVSMRGPADKGPMAVAALVFAFSLMGALLL
ncbi:glycolipid-anchored surface protein 5 [Drechmeria coniospora]|uniref:1,3-beta-glucanosyltransferase n=1 Tax=Drechmeria coniospora TaxID=98403 RepID=A0A151GTL7_DRECN|nr:glycolipid-anchored surface protein 5 [Drechmeria coniospora]KYK60466.1 glycolipid-anchored surface protein 5 [Drechmeria coniospora]ODA80621.1 hypothetical protein RJ55_03580 [Drechmeria coniospora]